MSTNPIWIAGYGGTPTGGASPVWIAGYGGAVAGASEAWIAGYGGTPAGGASPVWIASYGAAAAGAAPIWIGGYITGTGGGGALTPAQAYLARTVGGNEGGNAANITTLIDGLVADGVWAKLDALYILAQQNATDALLNLIGATYNATNVSAAPFVSYKGFGPFSSGGYLDTNFNASTAPSPKYTANLANYGVWVYAVVNENVAVMGNGGPAAAASIMYTSYPTSSFFARVNDSSGGNIATPGTKGLFVGDRISSSNVIPYWNGSPIVTLSSTSAGILNNTFTIGQSQGFLRERLPTPRVGASQTLCEAHIGTSLGAAGNLALYTRLRTYMTAVGVP